MSSFDNIKKYYFFRFFIGMAFAEAVFVLFLLENNLNFFQIMITQSFFTLIIIFLQLPSGVLSDLWSRKYTLTIGAVLGILGAITYSLSTTFTGFLIAESFWGGYVAMIFGTHSAFMYDSLKEMKKQKIAKKIFSEGSFYFLLARAITLPIGSLVASLYGLRSAMYLLIIPPSITLLTTLTFKEPRHAKRISKKYIKQIKNGINIIKKNELLLFLILNSVFVGSVVWLGGVLFQPYMQKVGIDVLWFGFIFAGVDLMSAFVCKFAYRIENKLEMIKTIIISGLLPAVGFLIMGILFNPFIAVLSIGIINISMRFREPVFSDYFNRIIDSKERATISSIQGLMFHVIYTILGLLVGYLSDLVGLSYVLITLSILTFFTNLIFRVKPVHLKKNQ